MNDKFKNNRN